VDKTDAANFLAVLELSKFLGNLDLSEEISRLFSTKSSLGAPEESTGVSPYEVVFGRLPRMPLELELGLPLSNPSTVSEYVQSARNALQDIRQLARENLTQARAKQRHSRENRNPVRVWKPFKPGQSVWLRRPKT